MKPRTVSAVSTFCTFKKSEEFAGIKRGDIVTVTGHGKFTFGSFVENERGETWCDVFDTDTKACRSFDASKVKARRGKRA